MATKDNKYVVSFAAPYTFEGKEYKTLDLSGLEELTSEQLFEVSKLFSTESYITPRPEADPQYCCMIAAEVCHLPKNFFDRLPVREMLKIRNMVQDFFQSEG